MGCRTTGGKREFIRVIRTADGRVEVDPTSKANGRGAYVCARRSCWDNALAKDRLARALRTTITQDDQESLRCYAEQFDAVAAEVEG